MSGKQTKETPWTDIELGKWISENEVPTQVNELEGLVDNWIANNAQYFDPLEWTEQDEKFFRNKYFTELGTYFLTSYGCQDDIPIPELHDLMIERVNDSRFTHQVLRDPRNFHYYYPPILYANYVDELEPEAEATLERIIGESCFLNAEHLPYRQLEFWALSQYLSDICNYDQTKYNAELILKHSLLNYQPNVVRMKLVDAYCLTHDVMFYNNHMGIADGVFPDQPAPYDISDLLRGLIIRFMADDNPDIVLELLLSGVLQRQISRQMVQFVLSWILEKTERHRFVPGPTLDKLKPVKSMNIQSLGRDEDSMPGWDYANEQEEIWRMNVHTNIVAGMTARILKRDWNRLDNWSKNHNLESESFRRDVMRLGQLMKSLAGYDLETGAHQMKKLSESSVINAYETVFQDAVVFLKNQKTSDGEFGYWTQEEMMYINNGNSRESFRNELVKPISDACHEAIGAVEGLNQE